MLQRLLKEIQAGGILEPGILAARLGTTPRMVAVMLQDLERLGWLEPLQACDSHSCEGCAQSGSCSPQMDRGRIWQLKKG